MATITTDTFLDAGVARTAGEVMTINGGRLRVRTDTRWHSNAPAAMAGTLGNVAISATLGGAFIIDGRNVRWLAYSGGSGAVPAIGANITRAGVTSSYLLGVYASLTSGPTAVGAAMPATGFIKLREVAGAFTAGALTGITATATGPDVVGWLEVVMRQAAAVTVPRLGEFRVRGDWFVLGTTTGAVGQVLQVPTNGGGDGTQVPAVWIETAPGSNEYEAFPALQESSFNPTNLGTDVRAKFVETMGNGQVRIGHNGTAACGFVPPAGCRVRVPNVFGRQCTTTTDAVNEFPHATLATRPDFTTTQAGNLDVENFLNDWYFLTTNAYRMRLKNMATFDSVQMSNVASPIDLDGLVTGSTGISINGLTVTACSAGGAINNCKIIRAIGASSSYASIVSTSIDLSGSNNMFAVIDYARSSTRPLHFAECANSTFRDTYLMNGGVRLATSTNMRFYDVDYCDRLVGTTDAALGRSCVEAITSSNDVVVDRLTFGLKGAVSNVNPYAPLFYAQNSTAVTFKNAGTFDSPLSCTPGMAPSYILHDAGANIDLKAQRCFVEATSTSLWLAAPTTLGLRVDNLRGTVGALTMLGGEMAPRGNRAASFSTTGQLAVYGTHCHDAFTSDTAGGFFFSFNEPTEATMAQYNFTLNLGENAGYTSGNQLLLPKIGDEVIFEMPYFAIGHTGFANTAPSVTGTGASNVALSYDLDKGTGFTGTFKPLTAANLFAETFTPTKGVRLRLRAVATSAVATTALTHVLIHTQSTLAAQRANMYPLGRDLMIRLDGLSVDTEVAVFNAAHEELDRQVLTGSVYEYHYLKEVETEPEPDNYILIWHPNKHVKILRDVAFLVESQEFDITQEDDYLFIPGNVSRSTFDPATSRQILDTGTTQITVPELYSDWKHWVREGNNARYPIAYVPLGGEPVTAGIQIPYYAFLQNSWRIRPYEANHTLTISGGTLVAEGDPIADTLSNFRVRINYQQPLQAFVIGTTSPQQIRDAMALGTTQTPEPGSVDARLGKVLANTALIPTIA